MELRTAAVEIFFFFFFWRVVLYLLVGCCGGAAWLAQELLTDNLIGTILKKVTLVADTRRIFKVRVNGQEIWVSKKERRPVFQRPNSAKAKNEGCLFDPDRDLGHSDVKILNLLQITFP